MGVVYRAERDVDGGVQIVALKLIAAGFTEPALIRRFERERSILARLQHPNIAHFIDGGMSADGSPWLAMQYIDGEDLLRWCDARRLTLRERVTLFLQVIDAAGFAHRNLVVHRDIKPSNILVDTTGQVRLLDFGIAKLLDEVADQGVTGTAAAPMTPEYAAPEQILGEGVSTATDVHALGVVLFELLCGRLPYVIGNGRHAAAVICEQEPQRLRQALSRRSDESSRRRAEPVDIARQRSVSTQELRRTLDRDLEQIVATAIARAPKERYGSAEAFAEDLRAWLDDRRCARAQPARRAAVVRRHRVGSPCRPPDRRRCGRHRRHVVAGRTATMQALRADAARRVSEHSGPRIRRPWMVEP
jgi:serine/threonine-protein kinase